MKFAASRRLQKTLLPIVLLVLLAVFGAYNLIISQAPYFESYFAGDEYINAIEPLADAGLTGLSGILSQLHWALGWVQLAAFAILGLLGLRRAFVLHTFKALAWVQALLILPLFYIYASLPGVILGMPEVFGASRNFEISPGTLSEWRFEFVTTYVWIFVALVAAVGAWLVLLGLRVSRNLYFRTHDSTPDWGDRVLENLRTHGRAPDLRRGAYLSIVLHLFIILMVPWLMTFWGCSDRYDIPKGTGENAVTEVVKRKVKKEEKKKIVLNMNSPFIFHRPEIDESEIFEELDEITQETYEANTEGSGIGQGGPGKGGWPQGVENAVIRFIRLKVGGGFDWDQDMGEGADYNFLIKFQETTKFKIAKNTEAIGITQLRNFPSGKAPPFVYFTGGNRGTIKISKRERDILRNYLIEEGGMIFADAGGRGFDRPFRQMMKQVLPEYDLVVISHDDPIFQSPTMFPEGAHPFWAHAGTEAMGIKHNGRWVVFYHPGDINDAWKTGHSGAKEHVANAAYKLGTNVVYYSFVQYYRQHYGE